VKNINRLYHQARAFVSGYFWLPCPICGQYFGGHEKGQGDLMTSWFDGVSVCPNCAAEAQRRNDQFMAETPRPIVELDSRSWA